MLQLDPPARDSKRSGFFTDWTRHLTNSSITADQLGGFVIHTAATRPPSATGLVSGGRLCCGNGTLGGGASVEVGGQNQSVGTDTWWLVGRLHRQSALHHWVTPGEPTARRWATLVQRPVSVLLRSCRVLDMQSQHTALSERRNVPSSVPRSSSDALFFFPCNVGDGVTLSRSVA